MQGKPPVLRIGPQGGKRRVPSRPCRGCPADSIFSRSCTRAPQSIPPVVTLQPRRANHQWRISFSVVTLQPCRANHQWRISFSVMCLPCRSRCGYPAEVPLCAPGSAVEVRL